MDTMAIHREWASRPPDERFVSLPQMHDKASLQRRESGSAVLPWAHLEAVTDGNTLGVSRRDKGGFARLTHWSFGQVARAAEAPADYLRQLPAPLAAKCLNTGLYKAENETQLLWQQTGAASTLRAATGPKYGRIHNAAVIAALMDVAGDGVSGAWKVPGEFGKDVTVTKQNTTLYMGDRDLFIALADEKNRIELPNRRNGKTGSLARGVIIRNSEVGASSLWVAQFLFDFICSNRMIWGCEEWQEVRVRHTRGAPERWLHEAVPAIQADDRLDDMQHQLRAAQVTKLPTPLVYLTGVLGSAKRAQAVLDQHLAEEGRPVESLWDAATGITAYARELPFQDSRVQLETLAGKMLAAA